jgi:hypothetical protein
MGAIKYSETAVLSNAASAFFIVTAVKTTNLA